MNDFPTESFLVGNLHLNVVADAYLPEIESALEPYVYEVVGVSHLLFLETTINTPSSISTGIHFCRTWDWRHENACSLLLEECTQHTVDE